MTDVERSLGQEDEWGPWIPMHYGDGVTPMERDGNPIFDGYSQALGRAFRIIQQPSDSEAGAIAAWITTYDLAGEKTLLPESELVLNVCLSDESAEVARGLLRSWMKAETTPSAMNDVIAASVPGPEDSET